MDLKTVNCTDKTVYEWKKMIDKQNCHTINIVLWINIIITLGFGEMKINMCKSHRQVVACGCFRSNLTFCFVCWSSYVSTYHSSTTHLPWWQISINVLTTKFILIMEFIECTKVFCACGVWVKVESRTIKNKISLMMFWLTNIEFNVDNREKVKNQWS